MTNVARQISTINCAAVFQQLGKLKGRRGGRIAYLNYFEFSGPVRWMRLSITNQLGHSEFQDIQGRLGL